MAFAFYTDSSLTVPLAGNLVFEEPVDHSSTPDDIILYYGAPSSTPETKVKASSDPGVDQIAVSITDSDVGNGHEAAEITLSADGTDWGTRTPGDPLDLGTEILSTPANAKQVHVRSRDDTDTQGNSTELGLTTNNLNEYDQ